MKTCLAAALFALATPLLAQEPAANAAEASFYKAYWLENGERNFAEAITLYEKFLAQAPEHPLAKKAATFELGLLTRAGNTDAATAFAKKHEKLLGAVTIGKPANADEPGRGAGRGARGDAANRGADQAARLADMKKQLAEAKESGDEELAARLERQIQRMEQGAGGQGGRRGGFGTPVEFAKMSAEELATFKTERLDRMTGMIDRLRENGQDERADQLETAIKTLKKALDDGKTAEAQAAYDKMMEGMRRRRGGGGGN